MDYLEQISYELDGQGHEVDKKKAKEMKEYLDAKNKEVIELTV